MVCYVFNSSVQVSDCTLRAHKLALGTGAKSSLDRPFASLSSPRSLDFSLSMKAHWVLRKSVLENAGRVQFPVCLTRGVLVLEGSWM